MNIHSSASGTVRPIAALTESHKCGREIPRWMCELERPNRVKWTEINSDGYDRWLSWCDRATESWRTYKQLPATEGSEATWRRGSSSGIGTCCPAEELGFDSRQEQDIFLFFASVQIDSGAHPASYQMCTGCPLPWSKAAGAWSWLPHLQPVPKLRIHGAISQFPQRPNDTVLNWAQGQFLYLYILMGWWEGVPWMTALLPASRGRCEPVTVGILGDAVAVPARDIGHGHASCNASEGIAAFQCRAGGRRTGGSAKCSKELGQARCER
jgi:hypothetical protein